MKVLIADDSDLISGRLVETLSKVTGIDAIDLAKTVSEASEAAGRLNPDVIVLDIQMPGGTGFDVLDYMKRTQVRSTVIVLTNFAYPQYRKKAFEHGASFFLDKSNDFTKVRDVIEQLMHKASS